MILVSRFLHRLLIWLVPVVERGLRASRPEWGRTDDPTPSRSLRSWPRGGTVLGRVARTAAVAGALLGLAGGLRAANENLTIEWLTVPADPFVGSQVPYTITARGHDSHGNLTDVNIDRQINGGASTGFAHATSDNGVTPTVGDSGRMTQDDGPLQAGAVTEIVYDAYVLDGNGNSSTHISYTVYIKAQKLRPTIQWAGSMPSIVPRDTDYEVRANAQDANGNLVSVNIYKTYRNLEKLETVTDDFAFLLIGDGNSAYSSRPDRGPPGAHIVYSAQAFDNDGGVSDMIYWSVDVGYVNTIPAAGMGPDTVIAYIGNSYNISVSGSDPEGDLAKVRVFQWAWEDYGGSYLPRMDTQLKKEYISPSGGAINTSFVEVSGVPYKWHYQYLAVAYDKAGAASPFSWRQVDFITQNHPPETPVLTNTNVAIQLGQTVYMTTSGTDKDGNLTYHNVWYQFRGPNNDRDGPLVSLEDRKYTPTQAPVNGSTFTFAFTPPADAEPGYYRLITRLSDPYASSTDVFLAVQVSAAPANPPTNVHAGPIVQSDRIQVLWDGSTSNNVAGYWLYWKPDGASTEQSQLFGQNDRGEWVTQLTPSTTYRFYLKALNGAGVLSAASNTLIQATTAVTPVITSATFASLPQNSPFSYTLVAANVPTSYSAYGSNAAGSVENALPSWLTFNATTRVLSGTPTVVGDTYVKLKATNTGGSGVAVLKITVTSAVPAPVLAGTSPLSAVGTRGQFFTYSIAASNSPNSYSVVGNSGAVSPVIGALPPGLSLNTTTGVISGTPISAAAYSVLISATNYNGTSPAFVLNLTIGLKPVIYSLGGATSTKGLPFSYQIIASNTPTSFSATGLPAGLTINTVTGRISGIPTASGTFTVTIGATNASGTATTTITLTITTSALAPVITSALGMTKSVGAAISYHITATRHPLISYGVANLPSGLSFDAGTGTITGSVSTKGTYNITISASNADGSGDAILRLSVTSVLALSMPDIPSLAGALRSNFSVDNKGAANYTFPLDLPPGRGGLQPSLSVGYSSAAGNGPLGIGYGLSTGFPREITRGRSILARDGVARGVTFDDQDKFYLDGKRLIAVSEPAGQAGSVYRTEVDSFVTITAYGTTSLIDGFKVVTKDGTTMYFGKYVKATATGNVSTTDAYRIPEGETQKALSWALKWVEDPVGNYIEFCYNEPSVNGSGDGDFTLEPGEHVLTSIRYTGHRGTPAIEPRYTVWLRHNNPQNQSAIPANTPRPDKGTAYQAGRSTMLSLRLDDVFVAETGVSFANSPRSFHFKYEPITAGPTLLRLIEVMRQDGTGSNAAKLATQLTWNNAIPSEWSAGSPAITPPSATLYGVEVGGVAYETRLGLMGDFNGDGRNDILFRAVTADRGGPPLSGGFKFIRVSYADDGTFTQTTPITVNFPNNPVMHLVCTGDFNGDGKTDLVWARLGKSSDGGGWYVTFANSDGTGFDAPFLMVANFEDIGFQDKCAPGAWNSALAVDLDGDGRDELLFQVQIQRSSIQLPWWQDDGDAELGDPAFFGGGPRVSSTSYLLASGPLKRLRYTGGTTFNEGDVTLARGSSPMSLSRVDLDGDGRSDLLATVVDMGDKSPFNGVYMAWTVQAYKNSGGDAFAAPVVITSHGGEVGGTEYDSHSSASLTLMGDVNGDGLEDIVYFVYETNPSSDSSPGGWFVALSKGNGTFDTRTFSGIPLTVPVPGASGTEVKTYVQQKGHVTIATRDGGETGSVDYISDIKGYGISGALLLDWNGDGKKDFLWYSTSPTWKGWHCFLAGPTGFDTSNPLPVFGASTDSAAYFDDFHDFTNDFLYDVVSIDPLGNGRESLLLSSRRDTWFEHTSAIAVAYNPPADSYRMTGVTDGLGANLEIEYSAISSDLVYTKGAAVTYPIRETRHMTVVTQVTHDNGGPFVSENQKFSYQYAGARTDVSGRGFLGFHSFVTLDWATNVFKYQFLVQSFPMTGLTAREETYHFLGGGKFRLLSSHDNVVVFDEVIKSKTDTAVWGTLYPFISQAVEYRWEDSATAEHFTLPTTGLSSQPEGLFAGIRPTEPEHIKITATSWFDEQKRLDANNQPVPARTTLAVTGTSFAPSDTVVISTPGAPGTPDILSRANPVTGATYSDIKLKLPREITYGNLTQLQTDFGDGFTETVVNTYHAPATADSLNGLLKTVNTSVSPGYDNASIPDTAPTKSYTYWNSTPFVKTESIAATDTKLNLTREYERDSLGRVTKTTVTGYNSPGDIQHIGTYVASAATAFDAKFDLPTTTTNAAPYSHITETAYDSLLGLPTSVKDMMNGTATNRPETTTQYDALGRVTQKRDVLKGLQTDMIYALTSSSVPTDWKYPQTVQPPAGHTGVVSGINGVSALTLTSAYATQTQQVLATAPTVAYAPRVWSYYDRLGRPIRTIKENYTSSTTGRTVTDTAYNSLGEVIAVSLPYVEGGSPVWTKTTYDALGRFSTVIAPNGTLTTNTYQGRVTKVSVDADNLGGVNPLPQINVTLVDAKGRTVKVWNADNDPAFAATDTKGATPATTASIEFKLDGFSRMRSTVLLGQTKPITAKYDEFGRQTELNDPDKGLWTYVNNAFGQVVRQTDANNNVTDSFFDHLGRPLTRTIQEAASGPKETATWCYYDAPETASANLDLHLTGASYGMWVGAPHYDKVVTTGAPGYNAGSISHAHYYDAMGRPLMDVTRVDDQHFSTKTEYDAYSRPSKVWPSWRPDGETGGAVSNWGYIYAYHATKGYVTSITDTDGRVWWDSPVYDHLDRVTSVRKGSGYTTARTYRATDGLLMGLVTSGPAPGNVTLQNLSFNYDGLGNLTSRNAAVAGGPVSETFGYDNLNRLISGSKQGAMTYWPNGNIKTKVDVTGAASTDYAYASPGDLRPHAVTGARGFTLDYDNNGNLKTRSRTVGTTTEEWTVRYPGFDKPRWMGKITTGTGAGTVGSEFAYDAAHSRALHLEFDAMADGVPSHYKSKKLYTSGAAAEIDYKMTPGGPQLDKTRLYLPGPDGLVGAMVFKGTASTPDPEVYHQDHLGSIESITAFGDTSGNPASDQAATPVPSRYSYDAWGERRNPVTWTGKPTATTIGGDNDLTPRGFTGHEMLDDLGLVHMNGRIYDPLLGRFLSADVVVQFPGSLQSYNRYSYVMNNPLSLTDPSGFFSWSEFGKGVAIGAGVAFVASLAIVAAPALLVAAGVSAGVAATVGTGLSVGATAYGTYSVAHSSVELVTGKEVNATFTDVGQGRQLSDAEYSRTAGGLVGGLAGGALGAKTGRMAEARLLNTQVHAEAAEGLLSEVTGAREATTNPKRDGTNRGDMTLAAGKDAAGRATGVAESVQDGGQHAESQVMDNLSGREGPHTIVVDQAPCEGCGQQFMNQSPPGSQLLVTKSPSRPELSPKSAAEKAADGKTTVEAVPVKTVPLAPTPVPPIDDPLKRK